MIIVAAIAAALFFLSFAAGNIYVPMAAVGGLALVNVALLVSGRGHLTKKNILLVLWFILLSHRALIPRQGLEESGPLFFLEIGVTLGVLLAGALVLLPSIGALRLRLFEGRFWLLAYAVLAAVSLLWTPLPVYSGFWVIRLACVAILVTIYFADATVEDCKKFFAATLLGSAPVILLPIIGYVTGESTGQLGAQRISGFWVHPGVASIVAFSVAAASLTALLQRRGHGNRGFHFYAILLLLGAASGFLASGKTGAFGGAIAVSLMLLIGRRFRLWLGMTAVATIAVSTYFLVLRDMDVGLFAHWQQYNFERLSTLQARFDLWRASLEAWSGTVQSVLLGRGFTSFRALHDIATWWGWNPGHAHNSFVTLLVDTGILGTLFFVAMLWRAAAGTAAMAAREGARFSESPAFPPFIALVSLLIGSLFDEVFGGTLQPTTYLLIGTAITLDRLVFLHRAGARAPHPADRPFPTSVSTASGFRFRREFPAPGS